MKLREKKTGKIYNWALIGIKDSEKRIKLFYHKDEDWKFKYGSEPNFCYYEDFGGLLSEFEIYEPVDPLIKDEKIRKAVRAWAEVGCVEKVSVTDDYTLYDEHSCASIRFFRPISISLLTDSVYTIAELCGEEE